LTIKGYTGAQIRGFYQDSYGAGRARLYVVGRFDAAAVEAAIQTAFGEWAKGTPVRSSRRSSSASRPSILRTPTS